MTPIRSLFACTFVILGGCAWLKVDKNYPCGTNAALRFEIRDDGCVTAVTTDRGEPANLIKLCRGATVTWEVPVAGKPNGDKPKKVGFGSEDQSPCAWKNGNSGYKTDKIEGKIRPDAQAWGYKYTVRTQVDRVPEGEQKNCPLDPMIIVRQ